MATRNSNLKDSIGKFIFKICRCGYIAKKKSDGAKKQKKIITV